ncbi:hypothetical protein RUM43_002645 [Polyplax serrata]|uniref:Uncharacterized protein n=1 Tax=Polyplax serrata TaxID=468196 RepID=A0AAN8NTU2_POLSC
MYENTQVPPPPVRARTKFYPSTSLDNSNFVRSHVDEPRKKSLTKSLANLTISTSFEKWPPDKTKTSKHKSLSKGKTPFPLQKGTSSRSMSNLVRISEPKNFFVPCQRRVDNSFRQNVAPASGSFSPLMKKMSKSLSNVTCSKGSRTAFAVEVKTDRSSCCVHRHLPRNSTVFMKPRHIPTSYEPLNDSNWSLQSSQHFQTLFKAPWVSLGKSSYFGSRNSEDVKNAQLNLISSKTGTSKISVPVTPPVNGVSTGRNTNFENYEDHCNVKCWAEQYE